MPVLAGQDAAYIAQALAEYRSGVRNDPTMRHVVEKVSPEDAQALGEYYAQYEWLEKLQ
jgi:cytochrome c553